ncbi:predicted protein [Nematostella vectensis]|uniref:Uncharacterized protein n=1 Tax=Nematostella vectensis TaxID=45351 RepID=A7S2T2_NEMVE|nr:predicted protein [Nematostella vectensis]|eukprot:XP_001634009.1 predicted protein [Nematostella vectensis]
MSLKSGRRARSYHSCHSANIEVFSDVSGSGSLDYRPRTRTPDFLAALEGLGRTMDEVTSYHTLSNSVHEMQLSVDLSSAQEINRSNHSSFKFNPKSSISTLLTLIMLLIGIVLVETFKTKEEKAIKSNGMKSLNKFTSESIGAGFITFSHILRATGLFGFAGGITNWIGIKIIFNRMPGLLCRGFLAKHFTVARGTLASFLLEVFFSPTHIRHHTREREQALLEPQNFEQHLHSVLSSDEMTTLIDTQVDSLMATAEGLTLRSLGMSKDKLRKLVKTYILDMKSFISTLLIQSIQSSDLTNAEKIREQVVDLIATRTQQMTQEQVKQFVYDSLYKHVMWLVLWGNVFGAIVGFSVEIISIYTNDLPWTPMVLDHFDNAHHPSAVR